MNRILCVLPATALVTLLAASVQAQINNNPPGGSGPTGRGRGPGVEASVWNAFFLPLGTPEPIVRKLNRAMSDTVDDPTIRRRLEELGLTVVAPERRSPEYLAKYLPQEIERWRKVVVAAGISAD